MSTYEQIEMFPAEMFPRKRLDTTALVIAICNEMFRRGILKIPHMLKEKDIFLQLFRKLLNLIQAEKRLGMIIDVTSINRQEIHDLLDEHCTTQAIICMEMLEETPLEFHNPPTGIEQLAKEIVELLVPRAS